MVGILVGAVLAIGGLIRLLAYLADRPFWIDEAMLSLNIASRSFVDLLRPLDYNQTAPVVFLWAERLIIKIAGVNEFALRALPLAAGIAIVPATWWLARRASSARVALTATALAAISPALVYYANDAKPYSIDGLITIALLGLTFDTLHMPSSKRAWQRLLIAGGIGVLISTTACFILSGIATALLLASPWRVHPEAQKRLAAALLVWGGPFLILYLALQRPAAANPYLQRFWEASFLTPGSATFLPHAWETVKEIYWPTIVGFPPNFATGILGTELVDGLTVMLVVPTLVGVVWVARQRGVVVLALLLTPLLAVATASALHLYPIALRLVLFALPLMVLFTAAGLTAAAQASPRVLRPTVLACIILFFVLPACWMNGYRLHEWRKDDIRAVVEGLERRRRPGTPIYVFSRGVPLWTFYSTDWAAPDTTRLRWFAHVAGRDGPAFENAPSRGRRVRNEGGDLIYPYRGRRELIGISTGLQWRSVVRYEQIDPDPGWAENEASRIRQAANPEVWLFFAHATDGADQDLIKAVRAEGGRVVEKLSRRSAAAVRYRFQ